MQFLTLSFLNLIPSINSLFRAACVNPMFYDARAPEVEFVETAYVGTSWAVPPAWVCHPTGLKGQHDRRSSEWCCRILSRLTVELLFPTSGPFPRGWVQCLSRGASPFFSVMLQARIADLPCSSGTSVLAMRSPEIGSARVVVQLPSSFSARRSPKTILTGALNSLRGGISQSIFSVQRLQ